MNASHKTKYIVLGFSGSPDEGYLSVLVLEEEINGVVSHHYIKWPFTKTGNSNFDEWFSDYKNPDPPKKYGEELYNDIIPINIRQSLGTLINNSWDAGITFIKIRVGNHPLLKRIPFEILHDGNDYLQNKNRIMIRYIDRNGEEFKYKKEDFKRILIIAANPTDCPSNWDHDGFITEIESILKGTKFEYEIIKHATIDEVKYKLSIRGVNTKTFDAIFVLAHGSPAKDDLDGALWLENQSGEKDEYRASSFAADLRHHAGCFVLLCSCWSGNVIEANPLASVGHRLIFNGGPAGSVIAMQRPVGVEYAKQVTKDFIISLEENNLFEAYLQSVSNGYSTNNHGVPCMYTLPVPYEVDVEDSKYLKEETTFQKAYNSITSVFNIEEGISRVAIIYPELFLGMKKSDFEEFTAKGNLDFLNNVYLYRGGTTSLREVGASKGFIALLGKIFPPHEIEERIITSTDEQLQFHLEDKTITHFVLFGSKSMKNSRTILKQYSEDFEFEFLENEWILIDKREDVRYCVPNPSKLEFKEQNSPDYAVIEKVIDYQSGRVFFFIAGLRGRSTLVAGKYFLNNIDMIYRNFGSGGFQIVLKIPSDADKMPSTIISRSPKLKR